MIIHNSEVEVLRRDKEFVDELEKKIRTVPNFLGEQRLWDVVNAPGSAFFTVDEGGLVGAINIQQGRLGDAHVTFWDGRLKGRELVCREIAHIIMESAGLEMLTTFIPADRKNLREFAEEIGFILYQRNEGLLTMLLLKEDLENGNR